MYLFSFNVFSFFFSAETKYAVKVKTNSFLFLLYLCVCVFFSIIFLGHYLFFQFFVFNNFMN